ncbi:MAG: polyphosphate kinase 1 [Cytophagales bacterium]|nr:polyphosphate kinase 1 [Cytophagales bacterium]MDW8383159.1 polyphosphate kinase 1 [Flammeovirgaceae bacterium]
MLSKEKIYQLIQSGKYISRDLSWLQFNYRVLDQCKVTSRPLLDRLKFMAITASNLDEFFMIRVGSLYNYLDYDKERTDYSGLREDDFKELLFAEVKEFVKQQTQYYQQEFVPQFSAHGFEIVSELSRLTKEQRQKVDDYFLNTIFPMLTPMVLDINHPYPVIMNKLLVFGVVIIDRKLSDKESRKNSFIQIPQNIPRFFEIVQEDNSILFVPVEAIVKANIQKLFRNTEIESISLFRITRNGDFDFEDLEDVESDFIEEIKRRVKNRKTGRVVRVEIEPGYSRWLMERLKVRWNIEDTNIFEIHSLLDYTGLWQIINHKAFKTQRYQHPPSVNPLTYPVFANEDIFAKIRRNDILLHHPFNAPLWVNLLEAAAEDADVLAIKITIYRLAKDSRVTAALKKAAENGKYVSVIFEIKARFDEENNIMQGEKLREAGCFVIYSMSTLKTHAKAMLIVRREGDEVIRYVHMSSGNYNEVTAKLYTDVGLLTADPEYAHDIAEFFNAITGYSRPDSYNLLITAPHDLREDLIELVRQEIANAKKGLPAGIVIKINSLQDAAFINALYEASQAGVPIKLIVRGVCCLRPQRKGLSENIEVRSLVGEFLEHSRIYYFHNAGNPKVFGGSADTMVRSFEKRIEILFAIKDIRAKQEAINILAYCLRDNVNAYIMQENGTYQKVERAPDEEIFDTHQTFYHVNSDIVHEARLF